MLRQLCMAILLCGGVCFASLSYADSTNRTANSDSFQASVKQASNNTTDDFSAMQERLEDTYKSANNNYGIGLFNPTYILPAYYTGRPNGALYAGNTPDDEKLKNMEFKGQFSVVVPIVTKLFGYKNTALSAAYTQLSYWQFYANSQYFRETDYMPELFLSYNPNEHWLFDAGVVHESNGHGGDLERSWNRAYGKVTFAQENFAVSWKPWVLIFKGESADLHNPDIKHYMGNGQVTFAYKQNDNVFSLMSRNNIQSGFRRGALEATWSHHLISHFSLYLQGFSGYGQSLIEYNHYTSAVGVGITLNDYL